MELRQELKYLVRSVEEGEGGEEQVLAAAEGQAFLISLYFSEEGSKTDRWKANDSFLENKCQSGAQHFKGSRTLLDYIVNKNQSTSTGLVV